MTGADLQQAFAVLNLNLDDYFAPEVIEFFLAQWPEGQFVATSVTGEVVGVLCGSRLSGGRASVALLAVDSRWRGEGVGTSLLDQVRRACMFSGIRTLQLEVRTTNASAIGFYTRRGFHIVETLPGFYNDGGSGYRMVCDVLTSAAGCRRRRTRR